MKHFFSFLFLVFIIGNLQAQTLPVLPIKPKTVEPTKPKTKIAKPAVVQEKKSSPKVNIEPELVTVESGSFSMGSEKGETDELPVHTVTVSSFKISKYEITQAQWQAVMGNNPSIHKDCANCPVENVSWEDVQNYINKLNSQSGKTYRLPTEAEWEFAARGGNKSSGFNYSGSLDIEIVAWFEDNSNNDTHPVGQKQPNELGIYDMSGNVTEWCSDWYDKNYYASRSRQNPQGAATGKYRVLRGGSWSSRHTLSYRLSDSPDSRDNYGGFRVVLSSINPTVTREIQITPVHQSDSSSLPPTVTSEIQKDSKEKTPISIVNIEPELINVEGGSFMMGSERQKSIHQVTLSSFKISKYEVTQAQYQAEMGNNPSYHKDCANCPVEQVSWEDIQNYINELNSRTGKTYRLPTMAEWEFAARGGNNSKGCTYSGSFAIDKVAWYADNSNSNVHPVGQKQPNELGIYDMSGNVWEFCSDWDGEYSSENQTNPIGASLGQDHNVRGGSWDNKPEYCHVADLFHSPGGRFSNYGFRLVLSLKTDKISPISPVDQSDSSSLPPTVAREIQKDDKEKTTSATLPAKTGIYDQKAVSSGVGEKLGAELETLDKKKAMQYEIDGGVLVKKIKSVGPFSKTRMVNGFIITSVNGIDIRSLEELNQAIISLRGESIQLDGFYPGYEGIYRYRLNMTEK